MAPRTRSLLCVPVLLLVACSKGAGSGDIPIDFGFPMTDSGGAQMDGAVPSCRRIGDPEPGSSDRPLPSGLAAELRQGSTVLPVTLTGMGGSYAGETRPLDRCDPAGVYAPDRLVLSDVRGGPLATALRQSNSDFLVIYSSGQTTRVSGASFPRLSASYAPMMGDVPTLLALTTAGPSRQGDLLPVAFEAQAAQNDCRVREGQFWLTHSPGGPVLGGAVVSIAGSNGNGALRVPVDAAQGNYWLEGRIITWTGRQVAVRRSGTLVGGYQLVDGVRVVSTTNIPVTVLPISPNPQADRVAPQALAFSATPAALSRCQEVRFSLQLSDDQRLPAAQEVWVRLGPRGLPGLLRLKLTGGESMLSGTFRVPQDAPGGDWLAYPESIVDAAGNVGTGTLTGDHFTVNGLGQGAPAAVPAALFRVEGPEPPMGEPPARLTGIDVDPSVVVVGQPLRLQVNWTGASIK